MSESQVSGEEERFTSSNQTTSDVLETPTEQANKGKERVESQTTSDALTFSPQQANKEEETSVVPKPIEVTLLPSNESQSLSPSSTKSKYDLLTLIYQDVSKERRRVSKELLKSGKSSLDKDRKFLNSQIARIVDILEEDGQPLENLEVSAVLKENKVKFQQSGKIKTFGITALLALPIALIIGICVCASVNKTSVAIFLCCMLAFCLCAYVALFIYCARQK